MHRGTQIRCMASLWNEVVFAAGVCIKLQNIFATQNVVLKCCAIFLGKSSSQQGKLDMAAESVHCCPL